MRKGERCAGSKRCNDKPAHGGTHMCSIQRLRARGAHQLRLPRFEDAPSALRLRLHKPGLRGPGALWFPFDQWGDGPPSPSERRRLNAVRACTARLCCGSPVRLVGQPRRRRRSSASCRSKCFSAHTACVCRCLRSLRQSDNLRQNGCPVEDSAYAEAVQMKLLSSYTRSLQFRMQNLLLAGC